jgi:RES domain-containing protein
MLLWRLSGKAHAEAFDGGYGLSFEGRWNNVGHPVTYCATSPSLCVLEKLVHIEAPELVPDLIMVTYEVPEVLGLETIGFDRLPENWRYRDSWSQEVGSEWLRTAKKPLLGVPSAIVPLADSPDWNVLINHRHPASTSITIRALTPFVLDLRLL